MGVTDTGVGLQRYECSKPDCDGRVVQTSNLGNVPMYKSVTLMNLLGTPLTTNLGQTSHSRGWSKERIGYPTQKPLALLERIIKASSQRG